MRSDQVSSIYDYARCNTTTGTRFDKEKNKQVDIKCDTMCSWLCDVCSEPVCNKHFGTFKNGTQDVCRKCQEVIWKQQ